MNDMPDRSADLSQPLDRLGPDDTLKHKSDQLRAGIAMPAGGTPTLQPA